MASDSAFDEKTDPSDFSGYRSGIWKGFYTYGDSYGGGSSGNTGDTVVELVFEGNKVSGEGIDAVGQYVVEGELFEPRSLKFKKQYVGQHALNYSGEMGSDGVVRGTWSIVGSRLNGTFEIRHQIQDEELKRILEAMKNPPKRESDRLFRAVARFTVDNPAKQVMVHPNCDGLMFAGFYPQGTFICVLQVVVVEKEVKMIEVARLVSDDELGGFCLSDDGRSLFASCVGASGGLMVWDISPFLDPDFGSPESERVEIAGSICSSFECRNYRILRETLCPIADNRVIFASPNGLVSVHRETGEEKLLTVSLFSSSIRPALIQVSENGEKVAIMMFEFGDSGNVKQCHLSVVSVEQLMEAIVSDDNTFEMEIISTCEFIVTDLSFAWKDKWIVFSGRSELIRAVNLETTDIINLEGHDGYVTSIECGRDFLVSCSDDCTVLLWDLRPLKRNKTPLILQKFEELFPKGSALCAALGGGQSFGVKPNPRWMIVSSTTRNVLLFDVFGILLDKSRQLTNLQSQIDGIKQSVHTSAPQSFTGEELLRQEMLELDVAKGWDQLWNDEGNMLVSLANLATPVFQSLVEDKLAYSIVFQQLVAEESESLELVDAMTKQIMKTSKAKDIGTPQQNTGGMLQLMSEGQMAHTKLQTMAREMARNNEVQAEYEGDPKVKKLHRAVEKTIIKRLELGFTLESMSQGEFDYSYLCDIARAGILFQDCFHLFQGLWRLFSMQERDEIEVVRIKNRFRDENSLLGYRDFLVNLRFVNPEATDESDRYLFNGHIVELQLHLRKIHAIRSSGSGHGTYKASRFMIDFVLTKKDKAAEMQNSAGQQAIMRMVETLSQV